MEERSVEAQRAPSPWEQANRLTACGHLFATFRRKTIADGRIQIVKQCVMCGSQLSKALPQAPFRNRQLTEFDIDLRERHEKKRQAIFEEIRSQKNAEWWARYEAHLESPVWQAIRVRVLQRSKGLCECCGEARATEVHHLSYERLGNEALFDLAAVCSGCHSTRIHAREGRAP